MNDIRKLMEAVNEAYEDEPLGGPCRWWAMCDNPATTTELHPILGDVPICDRCVAKLRKIQGLDEAEGDTCVRCRKGTMEVGDTMYGPQERCNRCGYQHAVREASDMWPGDKPFPKKPTPHGTIANDDAELFIARAAQALAKDAVEQAEGVYNDEGDGEGKFATGAKNVNQYVQIAAPRFLTKDYKKAIIQAFQREFDEAVQEELRNYNERR